LVGARITGSLQEFSSILAEYGVPYIVGGFIQGSYLPSELIHVLEKLTLVFFISLIIFLTPISILTYLENRWKKTVDANLPSMLKELVDGLSAGLSLPQALITVAKSGGFGPLDKPLKKLAVEVSWGSPFTEALKDFTDYLDTKLARRLQGIIIEAYRSGGDVERVFMTAAEHLDKLWELRKTRASEVRPFMFIIYISFVVFLVITYAFNNVLFKSLAQTSELLTGYVVGGLSINPATSALMSLILFHAIILEGFFGGLIIGKITSGRIFSGLIHSVILLLIGLSASQIIF